MPRRAAPGNRIALWQELGAIKLERPTLLAALQELQGLLDVHDWLASALGPPFTQAAAVHRAAVIKVQGAAERTALELAAAELGLPVSTVRSRARRWPEESRPGVHYEPRLSPVSALASALRREDPPSTERADAPDSGGASS